ncbi:MAG: hypothetical protein KBC64_02865 [Simkaniaceae bacterium]|nr:hypothetical protein [Simkaniaceae bacterium]
MLYVWELIFIEVGMIVICMGVCLCLFLVQGMQKRQKEELIARLKRDLDRMVKGEIPYQVALLKIKGVTLFHLSVILKQFGPLICGEEGELFKAELGETLLKPQLKEWMKSRRFVKRVVAVQIMGFIQDEEGLLGFLKDASPLVRLNAMLGAMNLKTVKSIEGIIEAMAREAPLARYSYRDAFLRRDETIYAMLKERLNQETDPCIRECCLEVLKDQGTPW